MFANKSRFRRYFENIWNQKQDFVFDSNLIKLVVGQEELESSTSAVSERHSNQLNY